MVFKSSPVDSANCWSNAFCSLVNFSGISTLGQQWDSPLFLNSDAGFALLYLFKRLLRRFAPRNARSAFLTVFSITQSALFIFTELEILPLMNYIFYFTDNASVYGF